MEADKFSSSGLYWLCKEAENRSSAADSPVPELPPPEIHHSQVDGGVPVEGSAPVAAGEKRRRGRPPKREEKAAEAPAKRRKKTDKEDEDEDVCFICFDGGSLVVCDRGDCPKAYHPACIKRDEAFFRSKAKWTCGWHICSKCQKSTARYMCYTCTYSLCKGCCYDDDYLCVRGNKGFCSTCYRVILMIENIDQGNKETVQVDFDDKLSWEYLFKVYWICLKKDLSLTVDEISHAQKPRIALSKVTRREKSSAVCYLGNNGAMTRENPMLPNKGISYNPVKSVCDNINSTPVTTAWASKKLLDFVAYMRNGDTSVLSQKEVQVLLFDYVKRENLRDPRQRSEIICDSKLENLFGKSRVRHFEMLSLLEFHYLLKDDGWKDENKGGINDPVVRQVTVESNSDNLPKNDENFSHKVVRQVTVESNSDNLPKNDENFSHKVDGKDKEIVDISPGIEGRDGCNKLDNRVDSSGSTNKGTAIDGLNIQTCLKSASLSGVKSETSVASLSTGSTPTGSTPSNDREAENSWLYRDPNGKVQGPFRIEQFHKWSSTGIFPSDMRIWRLNSEERDSILLCDVMKGQFPLHNNLSLSPPEVKGTSESQHFDGPCRGRENSIGRDPDAHSNGKLDFVKGNGLVAHSPISTEPVINNDLRIENSSKCHDPDPDPPKAFNSYSNQPQVHSMDQVSTFTEKPHSAYENRKTVRQMRKSTTNHENWNSHVSMESWTTGRHYHENQTNKQRHIGQPSSGGPPCQNSSVNNLNSHESDPHCPPMANLPDSSKQNLSINLQDFPMPMPMPKPKASTGELQAQTIKEQLWKPSQVSIQNLSIQNVLSLTSKSIDHEDQHYLGQPSSDGLHQNSSANNLNSQYASMANLTSSSEQKSSINLQDFSMPMPKTTMGELQAQTIKEQRWEVPQASVQTLCIKNVLSLNPKSIDHDVQHYADQPSDGPIHQNSLVNNLNAQYASNLTGSSEQKSSIDLQEFPMPMPKTSTGELQAQTIKERLWEPAQDSVQNVSIKDVLSLTPKSIDQDEIDYFQNQKVASLSNNCEKIQATENKLSLSPNCPIWSSTSNLVHGGRTHVSRKATRPSMEEWDSGFLSVSSPNVHQGVNDHMATPTSTCDKLPPPSPPNPVPNASSWLAMVTEPIEFDTLAEESVSDLLAEVDAMESKSDLATPNLLMDYADDLFHDSKTNCFTSLRGLSSPVDRGKNDALSSSGNMMLPPQSAMREEPIRAHINTVLGPLKKPQKHSNTSSVLEADALTSKNGAMSFSGNIMLPPQSTVREEPIRAHNSTVLEPLKKSRKHSNTTSALEVDALTMKNDALSSSVNIMLPSQSTMREELIRAHNNTVLEPLKKPRKHSNTSSMLKVETKQFDTPDNQFESRSNRHNLSSPKKTRGLADIMNAPIKHDNLNLSASTRQEDIMNAPIKHENLNSSWSTRRESGQGTPRGSGSKNRITSVGLVGRESHQKHSGERLTSPRERNPSSGLTSPRDRNITGGDSGFSKGRPSWGRQSSFGGGGGSTGGSGSHSRTLPRGQRICKFFESGYCRKGAFCDYLHPHP